MTTTGFCLWCTIGVSSEANALWTLVVVRAVTFAIKCVAGDTKSGIEPCQPTRVEEEAETSSRSPNCLECWMMIGPDVGNHKNKASSSSLDVWFGYR